MQESATQKRRRDSSDTDHVSEAQRHPVRVLSTPGPSHLNVNRAEASDNARLFTGQVHGDMVHGNVSHINCERVLISNTNRDDSATADASLDLGISNILSNDEKQKLFNLLYFSQLDARLTNLRKAQAKTCEWMTHRKDYEFWMDSNRHIAGGDGLFWIRGNPGTGKSITMKFLYQKLQRKLRSQKDKLVFSFFFNARGGVLEKSTVGLYRSLLFNLFSADRSLLEALDHHRSGCLNVLQHSEWKTDHQRLLQEVLEEAAGLLKDSRRQLFLYVDALDECPENEVRDMITYFEGLVGRGTEPQNFRPRICFSSRHYPQIRIRTNLTVTLEMEQNHNNDIQVFVDSELQFDDDVGRDIVAKIKTEILAKSCGIFLWVNLVVNQLNEVHQQDGQVEAIWQRLTEIPKAAKEAAAPNGARPLYGLFQDIIKRDTRNIPLLARLVQLVYCAKRPLRPEELYVCLVQSYGEPFDALKVTDNALKKKVLDVSKGIVEITQSKEPTVQFIHETVKEFFRDKGLSTLSGQLTQIDLDGHEMFKKTCLDQVCAPIGEKLDFLRDYQRRAFDGYRSMPARVTKDEFEAFNQQAARAFPLLAYAVENVLYHANESKALGKSQTSFLESFPLAAWVPLHNLFEKYHKRRFSGSRTPLLYILAHIGCDKLVKEPTVSSAEYARKVVGEEFGSALECALCTDHRDTAWSLTGLDPDTRPQDKAAHKGPQPTRRAATLMFKLEWTMDVQLLDKVLGDGHCRNEHDSISRIGFQTPEMIDVLIKHSMLDGFPSIPPNDAALCEQTSRDHHALPFIRQAIALEPTLLTSEKWGDGFNMLTYAISKDSGPLVDLYFDLFDDRAEKLNDYLRMAARHSRFQMLKDALSRGADPNLRSHDHDGGCTVLHLAALRYQDSIPLPSDAIDVLKLLIEMASRTVNTKDRDGQTALAIAICRPGDVMESSVLQAFLRSGADPNTVVKWPHSLGSLDPPLELPPIIACSSLGNSDCFEIMASDTRCRLDTCDSWGRTALSWCFTYQSAPEMRKIHSHFLRSAKKDLFDRFCERMQILQHLLRGRAVDINARDRLGKTALEHLIKHPYLTLHNDGKALALEFLRCDRLDPNLPSSHQHLQHPLELIISLYGTWPPEFGDVDESWLAGYDSRGRPKYSSGNARRRAFSDHLATVTELLLGTGRVGGSVQEQCLGHAPPELQSIILRSLHCSGDGNQ